MVTEFPESYPYVRVVETLSDGNLNYMAADQVKVRLAEGVDVTDLKPMIDALGIRLRMFNRKERAVVLGVLHTGIDAVPDTLEALRPWRISFLQRNRTGFAFGAEAQASVENELTLDCSFHLLGGFPCGFCRFIHRFSKREYRRKRHQSDS